MLLAFLLAWFASVAPMRAVSPTPDGGYPGANTAEGGAGALFRLTTGSNNTAVGAEALNSVQIGSQNTAIGAQALRRNVADRNTADGFQALVNNHLAPDNTAAGWRALFQNTEGNQNTAIGSQALYHNTTGGQNTAVGFQALFNINSLFSGNTAVGAYSSMNDAGLGGNTAVGAYSLMRNPGATGNTAVGTNAMVNTQNDDNTAVGFSALSDNTTGVRNVAVGSGAGDLITGNDNIDIGYEVSGPAGEEKTIRIGTTGFSTSQTRSFVAGIYGTTTGSTTTLPVIVDVNGQLGTAASSERFKKDIKPIDNASQSIFALKPVRFHYKADKTNTAQLGLIAEEVEKVNPDLVVRDQEGKPYTVRYDQVNAMLLNEFLKEHRKVEDLQAAVARLTQRLEEQDSKIAKIANQPAEASRLVAGSK